MKLICERDKLKDALALVSGRAKGHGKNSIPILSHVLLSATASKLTLTGNDLDACSEATIVADVQSEGAIALNADTMGQLVSGFATGAQIMIESNDRRATIRAGRSRYQVPFMSADDFPDFVSTEWAAEVELSEEQAKRLFGTPEPCVCQEQSRPYLNGIFIHADKEDIVAVGTDGHRLLAVRRQIAAGEMPAVIVPDSACKEIAKIATDGCRLAVSTSLISLAGDGWRYTSKLIDGNFPDYSRVIPRSTVDPVIIEAAGLDAVLSRLAAVVGRDGSRVAQLSWREAGEASLKLKVRADTGEGEDCVECEALDRPEFSTAFQIEYLRSLIATMKCKRIALYIDGPGDPIRIQDPDASDVVAVLMPCRY